MAVLGGILRLFDLSGKDEDKKGKKRPWVLFISRRFSISG